MKLLWSKHELQSKFLLFKTWNIYYPQNLTRNFGNYSSKISERLVIKKVKIKINVFLFRHFNIKIIEMHALICTKQFNYSKTIKERLLLFNFYLLEEISLYGYTQPVNTHVCFY